MPKLPERARRRLELAGSELPLSAQRYFLKQEAMNWGVVAMLVLLLLASIAISISMATGQNELQSEIDDLRIKWAYEQGRADESDRRAQELEAIAERLEADYDALAESQKAALERVLLLRRIERHVADGGDLEGIRELLQLPPVDN